WRTYHPAFQAELARRRVELFGNAIERIRSLIPKERSLEGADKLTAAQAVLRMAGLGQVAPPSIHFDDAGQMIQKLVGQGLAQKQREREKGMTEVERVLSRLAQPDVKEEARLAAEATDEVNVELRRKLSHEHPSRNGKS